MFLGFKQQHMLKRVQNQQSGLVWVSVNCCFFSIF